MTTLARLFVIPLLFMLIPFHFATAEDDPPALSDGEIRQLLAPIALYPDALLSQVLIAATYPLEVVEAARWVRDNPGLEGQEAVTAVEDRDWDLSVKSLVAFPEVIERMSLELDWTRRLGEAFLMQEEAVIAAVQDLRERADAAGSLETLDHARARRDGDVIIIEPAQQRFVHVPYYTPRVVYGGWWWPDYPPYHWRPSSVVTTAGFYWGSGVFISSGFYFSSFDWRDRYIVISNPYRRHFRYVDSPRWRHDPYHRRGVVYRQPALNRQFGHSTSRPSAPVRQESRPSALRRHHGAWERGEGERSTIGDRRAGSRTYIPSRGSALNRSTTQSSRRATETPAAAVGSRSTHRSTTDRARTESTRSTRGIHSRSSGSETRRSSAVSPRSTTRGFTGSSGSRSSGGGAAGRGASSRGSALSR